ncbi:MAG: InlB B-repeat-containing protein [Erysipelotrichaceae bacterium]|nr:InlB B-repeat-containing protein [Erysipelotrichaceae bacterium]
MKKFLISLLLMGLVLSGCSKATKVIASGQCGDEATWQVEQDGTLRISGKGAITKEFLTYTDEYDALHDHIKRLVIEDGITEIDPEASFANVNLIEEIYMPDTMTGEIDEEFSDNPHLKYVRIGKLMNQTSSSFMNECEALETVENASDHEVPLSTEDGKRIWYVDKQQVKVCPPHKTAHAEGRKYKLTYDFNGGQEIDMPNTHQYGKVTKLNQPEKEGMSFMGWYGQNKNYDDTLYEMFYDEIPTRWSNSTKFKAMYADYSLEAVDGGFKVIVNNAKDFEEFEEYVCFRYSEHEDMSHPIWGGTVAPISDGTITGLEKGKTYYVELNSINIEWWTDANPEDDVEFDEYYHCKKSITVK